MGSYLITGGTGFVGLNTAKAFAARGDHVVVTSRRRHDDVAEAVAAEHERISVAYVDLQNSADVFDLHARHAFDGAVMLAHAHQYARTRAASNAIYAMTLNCLDGALSTGVKRVILGSSKAIYGPMKPPLHEDVTFPIKTTPPPGGRGVPAFETTVKRTVEMIAHDYAIPMPPPTSGLSAVESRPLEVAALRFPLQWGQGYTAMGNPFSLIAHTIAGHIADLRGRTGYLNLPPWQFWNIFSGGPSSYVKDSASAIVAAMTADSLPHAVYNVTSGYHEPARTQLEQIYERYPDAVDRIAIDPADCKGDDGPDMGFTNQRLRTDFGWQPTHGSFADAFSEYVDWLRDNPH